MPSAPPLIANVPPNATVVDATPVSAANTRPFCNVSDTSFIWPCVAALLRSASVTFVGSHFVFVKPDTVPSLMITVDVTVPSGCFVVTVIPSGVTAVLVLLASPT